MKKKSSLFNFHSTSHWPAAVVISGGLSLLLSGAGHAQEIWTGGGGDDNFGTNANWFDGSAPAVGSGTILHFTGGTRTTPNNNYTSGDNFGEWWLLSGASSPFTIGGSGFGLFNKIENSSSQLFTINTAGIFARDGSMEINPVGGNITTGSGTNIELDGNTTLNVFDGNNNRTLTINGTLSNGNGTGGNGALVINQTATVILAGTNDYGGTVLNNSSKLRVGAGGTTGTLGVGNVTLNNTSSLIFDRSNAITVTNPISGAGSVTKLGADTLTLQGSNSFSGGLTIKAGTVFNNTAPGVNGLGSGKVTIGDVANTGAAAELLYIGTTGNNSFSNLIDVRGNGTATIRVLGYNPTFSGAVNLANNLNVVSNNNFGSTIGISGGITGTGNLVIQSNAANGTNNSAITFSGTTLNFAGSITNSGTTTSTTASNTTISAVIGTNVTGITQNSTNSQLTLSGNNTYTGNVLVSLGQLNVTGARTGAATSGALGNPTTANRTVTISNGGTLNFSSNDVMGDGGSAPALTIIANGGIIRNGVNGINSLGPVQLNGGTLNSNGTGAGFKLTGTVTVGGSALSQIISGGSIGSSGVITYDVADAVAGSGNDLNVTAVVGDIFGAGGITKTGAGTMTLTAQNTFTGGTRVDNGTLALGHATNTLLNAGAVNVNGGTLALGTNTDTVGAVTLTSGSITGTGAGKLTGTGSAYDVRSGTISAKLGGTVGLTKSTAGTVTISSDNSSGGYTGATAVNAGTLVIDGNISTSITTVASGATLSGSGTVGTLTVQSGGFHSPGNSPGIQNTGDYTLAGILNIEINSANVGTGYDQVNTTGSVTLSGLLAVTMGYTPAINQLFFILANDLSDTVTGTFSNASINGNTYTLGGQAFQISYFGNQTSPGVGTFTGGNDVVLMAVPEPNVAALLGSLGALALLRRRRN